MIPRFYLKIETGGRVLAEMTGARLYESDKTLFNILGVIRGGGTVTMIPMDRALPFPLKNPLDMGRVKW